jgi:hypothetical protein
MYLQIEKRKTSRVTILIVSILALAAVCAAVETTRPASAYLRPVVSSTKSAVATSNDAAVLFSRCYCRRVELAVRAPMIYRYTHTIDRDQLSFAKHAVPAVFYSIKNK